MRRLSVATISLVILLLSLVGCQEVERAQYGDFKLLTPVKDNKIILNYDEGSSSTIDIMAKYDWEILPTKNFTCTPNRGAATESATITIRASHDNNTTELVKLDDLNFRLLHTRFTGLSVYQQPRMTVDRTSVMLSSPSGSTNMVVVNSNESFEVVYDDGLPFTAVVDSANSSVLITALEDNVASGEQLLGSITIRLADEPSCKAVLNVYQRANDTPQTIFGCFLGTSLLSYYRLNIDDMMKALNADVQGKSRVVVLIQSSTTKATFYELRYDAKQQMAVKEKVRDITLTTPYNAAQLTSILRDVIAYAPAEKYALIFGSHGTAWLPKGAEEEASILGKAKDALQGSIWKRREDALPTRYIGDADNTGYNVEEIGEAVRANNIILEYIIYDACFMGNIESAYELRDVTKHIVASPCEMLAKGLPYKVMLPHLLKSKGTAYDLDAACKAYVDDYIDSYSPWACVATVVTSELEPLAALMREVNEAEKQSGFTFDTVQYYEGLDKHIFYDLEDYVRQSCADTDLVEKFKAQLAKCVLSRYHTDKFYTVYGYKTYIPIDYYSGVSTSIGNLSYPTYWEATAWCKDTMHNNN